MKARGVLGLISPAQTSSVLRARGGRVPAGMGRMPVLEVFHIPSTSCQHARASHLLFILQKRTRSPAQVSSLLRRRSAWDSQLVYPGIMQLFLRCQACGRDLWGRWPSFLSPSSLLSTGPSALFKRALGGSRNAGYQQHRSGCHISGNGMSGPDSGSICY